MKTVGEFVKDRKTYYITPDKTITELANFFSEKQIGAVAVLENEKLVGVVSERDIICRVIVKGLDPKTTKVRDIMTTHLLVANENDTYESCLAKMKAINCRHLPVISGDKLIGFISMRDILLHDIEVKNEEIKWLDTYIKATYPSMSH